MKRLRILVLMHESLVPPESIEGLDDEQVDAFKTELDVVEALGNLGHVVRPLGVQDELLPIRAAVDEWKPDIVFNLLEEFRGEAVYDQNVVAYLELLDVPYTGAGPRGLVLARDKGLSKKLVTYHHIRAPRFVVVRKGRRPRRGTRLRFPVIVKSLIEEASLGISKASVVHDFQGLQERAQFIHDRVGTDAIAEEFISGRELYVSILGNDRLTVLPPSELVVRNRAPGEELIATAHVKHSVRYQKVHKVDLVTPKHLPEELGARLTRQSKRIYRLLDLQGYGRIDYRLDEHDRLFFLEANPNPEIARYEEFASAAETAGIEYEGLLQRILALGLRRAGR